MPQADIVAAVEAVLVPLVAGMVSDLHALAATIRADNARACAELRRASFMFLLLGPVAGRA